MDIDREEWCRLQARSGRKGLEARFQPLEVMRCPATRTLSRGAAITCGAGLGRAPDWVAQVVVRAVILGPSKDLEPERRVCHKCRKPLDVFYLPHPVELRATG